MAHREAMDVTERMLDELVAFRDLGFTTQTLEGDVLALVERNRELNERLELARDKYAKLLKHTRDIERDYEALRLSKDREDHP